MALIDDILKRNQNSFYPTDEQDMQEQETPPPPAPVVKTSDPANKQPTQPVTQKQEAMPAQAQEKAPANKWGYSQSELDTLAKAGYTPEKLDRYLSGFDPAKGESFLSKIYESSMPKPTEPDEKKIRTAKIAPAIFADSLGLLSQMYTYGKGAHVDKRDYRNSASSQIAEQERNLRNIYLQQRDKYNDGLYNSRLNDFRMALDDYRNGRNGISGVLSAQNKLDLAKKQFEDKQRFNYDKLSFEKEYKDADLKLKEKNLKGLERHRKVMESQGWSRVADSRNRTSAYIKKLSSPSTGSGAGKNGYQMIFEASPYDKDVHTDSFGNKVKVFEMNNGQIDQYARQALSDPQFMAKHPDLIIQRPDFLGEGSYKYKPNEDIAATYLNEQYKKRFTQSPVDRSRETKSTVSWGSNSWMPSYDGDDADEFDEFAIE